MVFVTSRENKHVYPFVGESIGVWSFSVALLCGLLVCLRWYRYGTCLNRAFALKASIHTYDIGERRASLWSADRRALRK